MLYGLYLSTGGMLVQRHRLDVIANNMANVQTTGFKRDLAILRQRDPEALSDPRAFRYRNPVLDGIGGGPYVDPTYTEFTQGEVQETGNPLDICIKGQGFLTVLDGDQVKYTRDGRLAIDATTGTLSATAGHLPVLDGSGRPIVLDPSRQTAISGDGTISQDGTDVARIELTHFSDPHVLRKIGENLYANPTQAEGEVRGAIVQAGALEKSTVEPVRELVSMIETQRAYEANAQILRLQDQTLGRLINDLPRDL